MNSGIEPHVGVHAPEEPPAPVVYRGPLDWIGQSDLRTWLLVRSSLIFGIAIGLSVVLSFAAILAIAAAASSLSGVNTSGLGGASSVPAPSSGQLFSAFLVILSFFFFTAHLSPYDGTFSVANFSAYGVGSLLIALVVIGVSYQTGRRLQRRFPNSKTNGEAALRASSLAVPYWVGCLVLFLVGTLHIQNQYLGDITVGPSALGLVTPLFMVGGSAAIGAVRERNPVMSPSSVYALRGAVLALFAISLAIVGSLIGGIAALAISIATHLPTFSTPSVGTNSSGLPTSAPPANSYGPLAVLLGLFVALFFIPNGLMWLWGTALGLGFESAGWLVLIVGVLGAVAGGLAIRSRPGAIEQIAFGAVFGFGSFLLGLVSRPTLGAYQLGANPWVMLIVGLSVGAGVAFIAPYIAATAFGRRVLNAPMMQFALARLPLPELSSAPMPASPVETAVSIPQQPPIELHVPQIKFGRRAQIAAAVVGLAVIAAFGGNYYLSSQTTPDAAAVAYVNAVGSNSADAIWSHIRVRSQTGVIGVAANSAPQLLSENDLKAMLALPQNSHHARSNVTVTNSLISGDNATVSVSYTEDGQRRTDTVTLIHDHSSNLYLFYANWKVLETPGYVAVNLATQGDQIAIDNSNLTPGAYAAEVFPGTHVVTLLASGPFASANQTVTVQAGAPVEVAFQNLNLTADAKSAARQAIQSYFNQCAQQPSTSQRCPQQTNLYVTTPITWKLVGDPTKDLAFGVDQNTQNVFASGHFLMTAQFAANNGTLHRVSGGPYVLGLVWNGSFSVQGPTYYGISPTALTDPGATQATVLAAAKAGWQTCLNATTLSPPDCPFSAYGSSATAVKWTAATDPMAGAQVAWDGNVGIYKVAGDYNLTVSYTDSFGQEQSIANGTYVAEILWDGSKATLVDIE